MSLSHFPIPSPPTQSLLRSLPQHPPTLSPFPVFFSTYRFHRALFLISSYLTHFLSTAVSLSSSVISLVLPLPTLLAEVENSRLAFSCLPCNSYTVTGLSLIDKASTAITPAGWARHGTAPTLINTRAGPRARPRGIRAPDIGLRCAGSACY